MSDTMTRAEKLKVTLRRSFIGRSPKQRVILRSLGLRRISQTVVHPDRPEIRGMIRKVSHLLAVEEEEEALILSLWYPPQEWQPGEIVVFSLGRLDHERS